MTQGVIISDQHGRTNSNTVENVNILPMRALRHHVRKLTYVGVASNVGRDERRVHSQNLLSKVEIDFLDGVIT